MALDLSLLISLKRIFPFILVWVVVYALLEWKDIFGKDKKGLRAVTAFVVAMIFLISSQASLVIEYMTPWFVILIVFVLLMLMIFKLFGASDKSIQDVIEHDRAVIYWVIFVSLIVFFAALGKVYFTEPLPTGEQALTGIGAANATIAERGEGAFWQTLFHPKVIGVVFVFLLATFAIKLLAGDIPSK